MSSNTIPDKYKVDHLILLVGGNPLPNTVAGRLLLRNKGVLWLIHSNQTKSVADRLYNWFKLQTQFQRIELVPIKDESDSWIIREAIESLSRTKRTNGIDFQKAQTDQAYRVGIHYTGGTKAMAVHVYRAIEQLVGEPPKASFSYLNPRTLEIYFDSEIKEADKVPVGLATTILLEEMMEFHDDLRLDQQLKPLSKPLLPKTAAEIGRVYQAGSRRNARRSQKRTLEQWTNWRDEFSARFKLHRSKHLGQGRYQNWLDKNDLLRQKIRWPNGSIGQVLRDELGLQISEMELRLVFNKVQHLIRGDTEKLCGWLDGEWLEHHTLNQIHQLSNAHEFNETFLGVETSGLRFEVDVVAIRGYQLFAISCTTSHDRKTLKLKLFEAMVRAQQLGGDEARVALVCTRNQPRDILDELPLTIGNRVAVFGSPDLARLDLRLGEWIERNIGRKTG